MPRSAPTLLVTFHKRGGRTPAAFWEAVRPTRGRIVGGYMPIGRGLIPHDLGHLATECHFGLADGFWGLLARGATFARGTNQRPTKPGRQLIRDHRAGLAAAEALGNAHHTAWVCGRPTPVAETFDRLRSAWDLVPDDGSMCVHWPTLEIGTALPVPVLDRRR